MSFLSLAFLFALPLAAAPFVLHLFDRQRNVVIEWGAMQFLVEAARRRTSARRLQEWLLLLLRSLAIFCLVLALARPMLNSSWLGGAKRVDAILVIDNSLSMTRRDANTTISDAARTSAIEHLDRLATGDSARILLTSPYPIWLIASPVRISSDTRSSLRDRIKNIQSTQGHGDMLGALYQAAQAERIPGARQRQVFVFTDGQASDWKVASSESAAETTNRSATRAVPNPSAAPSLFADDPEYAHLQDLLRASPAPIKLEVVLSGARSTNDFNLAVNRVDCTRTIVGADQSVTFRAQVQNHGKSPSVPCSLQWSIQKTDLHQSEIPALPPGVIHEVVWNHALADQGVHVVTGRLDVVDALESDNRESTIVEVVERLPILVVESVPEGAEVQQDSFFVQAALGWVDGESTGTSSVFAPTIVTPDQLERMALHDYRAIIVPNLTEISQTLAQKLHSFASDGGGIWIACGPRTDIERFNQRLFDDGTGLSPMALDRIVESDRNAEKPKIDVAKSGHPANLSLEDTSRLDTASIVVSRRLRFATPGSGNDVTVMLRVTNGEPFAVEKLMGQGRVIIQAAPLKLQWTELVRSQAFVVMVQDWLDYLTQPLATRHNLVAGEPIQLCLAGNEAKDATLRTPDGEEIELTPDPTANGLMFQTSRTIAPGDYALEVGLSGDQVPFHVRRDSRESDLAPLRDADVTWLNSLTNARSLAADHADTNAVSADPVWPLLLIVLTSLILLELMLSGTMSRQRFGSDPIAENKEVLNEQTMSIPVADSPAADHPRKRRPVLTR